MSKYVVSHPPEDKCCHCGRSIDVDRHTFPAAEFPENIQMPQAAGRLEISFGYGSENDLRNFVMYICDECLVPFIESRKSKVGEFCCMYFDEDKKRSPNCVVDQTYSGRHHAGLEADGVRFVSLEEMEAALVDDPKGRRIDECKDKSLDGSGS